MKWILFGLLLLGFNLGLADEFDEQMISTESKNCAIHYLSAKAKKLWTIEVDNSYCHEGWVQGFATVILKDSLNRTVQTLTGFFQKGYWLSDFPGPIETFYRFTPKKDIQDFIFSTHTDKKNNAMFYMVASSIKEDDKYPPFNLCPSKALLLVVHEPVTDFEQSLFQSNILTAAQQLIKDKCPHVQIFDLVGGSSRILTEEDGPFRATVNLSSGETTLSFTSPIPLKEKLHPTELRHEAGEHLITIHPQVQKDQTTTEQATSVINRDQSTHTFSEIDDSKQLQSAVDLVLMAHVFQTPIQGKSVMYIDTTTTPKATHPFPLTLNSAQPLNTGWNLVMGTFNATNEATTVNVLWAKPCLKEWCIDEN